MLIFEDLLSSLVRVIFAFKRSYRISEIRESMLDMPVPGSFRIIGH